MFKSILPEHDELQILYQASQDTFKAKSFHSKCDNQGKTVLIAVSKNKKQIFGAYTDIPYS